MEEVGFCTHCGKVLESKFRYCPFCGTRHKTADNWETLLEECLAPLESQERGILLQRLEDLDGKVKNLEGELQEFLMGISPTGR